jgi:hypothetical protein
MPVVAAWLRLELNRRWRSLVVLALLVAIAGGTVMTAFAGARRGASVLERLKAKTLPAHAAITANTPNFDWTRIRRLPEVAAFTTFGPTFSIVGLAPDVEAEPAMESTTMRTIEKPVILKGRMFDDNRSDEAFVSPGFVAKTHKGLGSTVEVILPTPAQLKATVAGGGDGGEFTGPRLRLRIVGVGVSHWYDGLVMSHGVVTQYRANLVGDSADPDHVLLGNGLLRLKNGSADIARLRTDLARVTGRSDIEVLDLSQWVDRSLQQQTSFEAECLLAFGIAAFVAALFLVGQAIARYAAASETELQSMRALGLSPAQSLAAATAGPAVVGVVGGALGLLAAVMASQWFPIGTASQGETAPGIGTDWVVFGPGLAVVVILVAGAAAASAWLSRSPGTRSRPTRRSSVAGVISRSGLPVPVAVGARFALESGRGRTAVPVRPAIIGAVVGVLGVVAAFTFSRGVSDAADHPERFGQTFQLSTFVGVGGQDFGPTAKLVAALEANEDVVGIDSGRQAVATGPHGNGSVSLYAYSGGSKPLDVVVTSGRMPRSASEILLAPQSISALRTRVGARVELTGSAGSKALLVTGTGLVPAGPHNGYADGGWLTDAGYDALFDGFKFHTIYVTLAPRARNAGAGAAITAALAKADPQFANFPFAPPDTLSEVKALRQVRVLPIVLGAFLALLALGAVGHALATAVRRRSHDLAVLRALGLTQGQSRWVIVTQATLLALLGLIFGVPLGLALGRSIWSAVADYTPFQYAPPLAFWALVLVAPAALILANILAAWPERRAARLHVAQILRAE